ncbi:MAG: zinc-dependent alcohol dehydrogenase [Solirubrobacterales bacterium]
MATMRQLTFQGAGKLDWLEVPDPTLTGDEDALVRPVAVATCDLDPLIVRGETPFGGPLPLGHECVAEVVDVADGVDGVRPGGLVSVPFQISCGQCGRCRRGQTAHCESVPWQSAYGLPPHGGEWGGFLSDLVRVPYAEHMLVALPDGVDPVAAASVSDNIVDGWRTVAPHLAAEPEAAVLVVGGGGPGSIGLYAAGIAAALGAPRVVYVDGDERRLRIASELGAETIADPDQHRLGHFPITVDASADPAGLALAIRSTGSEGSCTSVGIYFQNEIPLPLFEAYVTGITFQTGRVHARPAIPAAMELIASGRLHPELVTTRVAGWEEGPGALAEGEFVKLVFAREAATIATD